ncbi:MAG: transposase, partial [Marinobacter sp.]|nr:transposase [Marinobacter sp.]
TSFRILTICDSLYRDFFMSFSVCLIVGRRTLVTHAPILGDGYTSAYEARKKVQGQWQLYCLVHNIEKLMNYGLLAA